MKKPENKDGDMEWSGYFWKLQYDLGHDFIIPLLSEWGIYSGIEEIIDLGAGEGGTAAAFAAAGKRVTAIDMEKTRIESGKEIAETERIDGLKLICGDIFDSEFGRKLEDTANLVLLLDVIEHVKDPLELLGIIRSLMKPDGFALVSFPPFYSPFGLHQQLVTKGVVRRVPWVQLLPWRFYSGYIKGPWTQDITDVKRASMTLGKFNSLVRKSGLRIAATRNYFIRPIHHLKFGMPVVRSRLVCRIPLLRELLISGTCKLLRKV